MLRHGIGEAVFPGRVCGDPTGHRVQQPGSPPILSHKAICSCSSLLVHLEKCNTLAASSGSPDTRTKGLLDQFGHGGYTRSMKTAISIPDDVFEEAERLAAELQTSRSQLYSRALKEFVARHAPDRLTEAMNRVVDEVGSEVDEFSQRAAYRVLERVEW
jgi:hypothetical protein